MPYRVKLVFNKSRKVKSLGRQRYWFAIVSPNGNTLCHSEMYVNEEAMIDAGNLAVGLNDEVLTVWNY